ncbi:MAG: bifunctional folylpolyglutamate synthase/dihydrofolate synthase [Desulfomonile tiedjei]|uniref:Dihydrofolate synthase/folylpolyglutamate synthase n=1 Tax=Desulfomonile tiedjei TaxID=2358 RepID=A0A9D6UY91_9BACT|nr:bifunctional folylpolyglutamate synthase/dihydrofolate synthase [Desulfomonile tiedjei]
MPTVSQQSATEEYDEAISFMYGLERFGILLGLDNIGSLLNQLGNPEKKFPSVHVAGSNGKGSTSSFVYTVLLECGLEAALYTSPHLNDFRERIRLNGRLISRESLLESIRKVRKIYDPERTTFFEFSTAAAFDCIARENPDIAVIEVGLGGRLDATNTVSPSVTVITDISREHEDYLGVGLAAVAGEKAGIIKERVPLITGAGRAEAWAVIEKTAFEKQAPVRKFGRDFVGIRTGLNKLTYRSTGLILEDLTTAMPGSHQVKNAALAIAVLEELRNQGYNIPDEAIRSGVSRTRFPGRFEILRRQPDVVIDGAHTAEGMRLLKSTIRQVYPGIKPLMLLGMLRDKNYERLIDIIVPIAREVVCVAPQGNRALDPAELASLVRTHCIPVSIAADITEGFHRLLEKASREDVVLATGSLYMIGPVRRACGMQDD